jgi:hypothetical protein
MHGRLLTCCAAALPEVLAPGAARSGTFEAPLDVRKTAEAKFAKAPAAAKYGSRVKVTFEASAANDAEGAPGRDRKREA